MNESQIHLALTHTPVILSFVGLVILILSMVLKNNIVTKTAFYILISAGLFAIPVFLTGEGAEEIIEHLPGISENVIKEHESFANISFIVILIASLFSLMGLIVFNRLSFARIIKPVVLLIAVASAVLMAETAHLGGQIRHTEIRTGFTQNETNNKGD